MIHPDSLASDRLRITVEYKETGADPLIELAFDYGPSRTSATSKGIQGEPDWRVVTLTAVRQNGDAWGDCLDTFTYSVRDAEVRLFIIADIGPIGDANLDGNVNSSDLQTVTSNTGRSGDLDVEEGDVNQDGVVNSDDASIVTGSLPSDEGTCEL